MIEDIRAIFVSDEDYYELIKTKGVFNNYVYAFNHYIESNGDTCKQLSLAEQINEIRSQ